MGESVVECPFCHGPFRVPPQSAERMLCPHCRAEVQVPTAASPTQAAPQISVRPNKGATSKPDDSKLAVEVVAPPIESAADLDPELQKLLPPKFLIPGTVEHAARSLDAHHVLIPLAEGGFQPVNTSIRHVQIAGRTVAISRLPSSRKRRRRVIRSIVLFTLCVTTLLIAFYLLRRPPPG